MTYKIDMNYTTKSEVARIKREMKEFNDSIAEWYTKTEDFFRDLLDINLSGFELVKYNVMVYPGGHYYNNRTRGYIDLVYKNYRSFITARVYYDFVNMTVSSSVPTEVKRYEEV